MNVLRRFWRWFTTPRRDETGEELRRLAAEQERRAHEEALKPKDLSSLAEVPPAHPGIAREETAIPTRPVSDWDLLSDRDKALFEQITPHDESKTIRYPAPVGQTTQDWVTEQLTKAGYNQSAHLRFVAFRRVAVGMSMRHLNDLKQRANERDSSLTAHDLIALRSRGIC